MKIERAVFIISALLLAASAAWVGFRANRETETNLRSGLALAVGGNRQSAERATEVMPPAVRWSAPFSQDRGARWRYELFSPPLLRFDPRTKKWAMAKDERVAEPAAKVARLELVEIVRRPYRVQLVGFAGEGAQLRGLFALEGDRPWVWRGAQQEIAEAEVRIESLAATNGRKASAVMYDRRTGKTLRLEQSETMPGDEGEARFRDLPGLWREGDQIGHAGRRYVIRKTSVAPPAVELARVDEPTSTLRLTPVRADEARENNLTPIPQP